MSNPGSIFISYRRSDSIAETGRIYDYLEQHFGRERVFKDVDSIPLGVNFREYLDQAVGRCQVLVAVIGPKWLTVTGDDGFRRIDSPADFVRIEIEAALKQNIPVIPLLVNGATIPSTAELPGELKALPDWQCITIRHDPDFRRDVNKLIQGMETIVGQTQSQQFKKYRAVSDRQFAEGTTNAKSSGDLKHSKLQKRNAIPWIRLAIIFGCYAIQGSLIISTAGVTGRMTLAVRIMIFASTTWLWAWGMAKTQTASMFAVETIALAGLVAASWLLPMFL